MNGADIENRLKRLFESVGLSTAKGTKTYAEIKALSYCLKQCCDSQNDFFDNIFINSSGQYGLSAFADLLKLKSSDDLKQDILSAMAQRYKLFNTSDFENGLKRIIPNAQITINGFVITVGPVNADDERISKLCDYLSRALPAMTEYAFDGDGITFEQWDAPDETFAYFDRRECPFSVIETMKG